VKYPAFYIAVFLQLIPFLFAQDTVTTPPPFDFEAANAVIADSEYVLNTLNWLLVDAKTKDNDFDGAVSVLKRIIALDEHDIEAYSTLGFMLVGKGDLKGAEETYAVMIKKNPLSPDAAFEYGFYFYRLEDNDNALKWWEKAFLFGLEPPKVNMYADLLDMTGQIGKAAFVRSDIDKRFYSNEETVSAAKE